MANERDIEIVITAKDLASGTVEELSQRLSQSKDAVGGLGAESERHGKTARLAFWSMGEAVQDLGEQFGITGKAGRQVGNVVEDMVSKLGGYSLILGGVTLAVGAAVMIWKHHNDQQKKHREELDKSVSSLKSEVQSLGGVKTETMAVREANERLFEIKQAQLSQKYHEKVKLETEELKKLNSQLLAHDNWLERWVRRTEELVYIQDNDTEGLARYREELAKNDRATQDSINTKKGSMELERAQMAALLLAKVTFSQQYIEMTDAELAAVLNRHQAEQEAARTTASIIAMEDELISYAAQAKGRVVNAAYQSMETQLLRLVETHKFSVSAFGKAIMQQVKMELIGLAARAAVYALFETAMGFATMFTNPAASAAHFTAAGQFALISAATVGAAMAVNAITGPGAARGAPGSPTGEPIQTQPVSGEGGAGATAYTTHISITALDPLGMQEVVEKYLIGAINEAGNKNITINANAVA